MQLLLPLNLFCFFPDALTLFSVTWQVPRPSFFSFSYGTNSQPLALLNFMQTDVQSSRVIPFFFQGMNVPAGNSLPDFETQYPFFHFPEISGLEYTGCHLSFFLGFLKFSQFMDLRFFKQSETKLFLSKPQPNLNTRLGLTI